MAKEVVNNSGLAYNSLTTGSVITGNISSESDFRIDGEVQGDIQCKGKVVVGQTGKLKGTISCANAEIIGNVLGNLIVSETVTLRATSIFTGDIKTQVLIIEPQAVFNGTCSMKNDKEQENLERK